MNPLPSGSNMDTDKGNTKGNAAEPKIDPLRRVFIPIERRKLNGNWVFRTQDGQQYERDKHGVIRRAKRVETV